MLKLSNAPVRQRMATVKREMRSLKLSKSSLAPKVYYDQMDELQRVFNKLKTTAEVVEDLDSWCALNPSDLECRKYE